MEAARGSADSDPWGSAWSRSRGPSGPARRAKNGKGQSPREGIVSHSEVPVSPPPAVSEQEIARRHTKIR